VTDTSQTLPMRMLAKMNARIASLLGVVLGVSLAGLVAIELMQIVLRYAFDTGFSWVASVQTELLLCLAWFGVAKLWIERRSLSMSNSIAPDNASRDSGQMRSTKSHQMFLNAVIPVVTSLLMFAGAIFLFPYVWEIRKLYGGIDMPGLPVTAAIKSFPLLLAMSCITFACVFHLLEDIAKLRKV